MANPTFQEVMLPILKFMVGSDMRTVKECVADIEQTFHLTDEDKQERLPSDYFEEQ
jgi:restriction endonuclease Mrr